LNIEAKTGAFRRVGAEMNLIGVALVKARIEGDAALLIDEVREDFDQLGRSGGGRRSEKTKSRDEREELQSLHGWRVEARRNELNC
jgi:hypothetical protein